eukprot:5988805-Heterocapsa_arctica.AAC.1
MKLAVTFGRPFGHISGQVTERAEKIETSQTGSIKDLHQNLSSNGLKNAHIGRDGRERPPSFVRRSYTDCSIQRLPRTRQRVDPDSTVTSTIIRSNTFANTTQYRLIDPVNAVTSTGRGGSGITASALRILKCMLTPREFYAGARMKGFSD